jgi:hypothetical protein
MLSFDKKNIYFTYLYFLFLIFLFCNLFQVSSQTDQSAMVVVMEEDRKGKDFQPCDGGDPVE